MSDITSIIGKIDSVIVRIAKSKKKVSVRILEEVKRDLQNAPQSSGEAAIPASAAPRVSVVRQDKHDGANPYVAQNGEVDDLIYYITAGENVLITGPTGCGKTHLVDHVTKMLGFTYESIQGEDGVRKSDIIGYPTLVDGENGSVSGYQYGILPRCMTTEKCIAYWDEPNLTPDGVRSVCFAAMDHRRQLTLPESKGGEVIKAWKGFTFIGACNEGREYKVSSGSAAFRARWGAIINLDYLPEAREKKLLVDRTGVNPAIAAKLCAAARQLRSSLARKEITTPISTRALLSCCNAIQNGAPIERAIECSIINQVEGTKLPERKSVSDVIAAYMKGAKVNATHA
jgi:MoxR-like ATPase